MAARFRLKRLEATAWRGIRDAVTVPLDQPLNIISGPNGSGKSSLLTAIEWALFPRESLRISDHHIGERREWEVTHLYGSQRPQVKLLLGTSGKRELAVNRVWRDGAATPVRVTYDDFKGLVFLHQETLRDFLVGTAGARQSAFQRLLGAGWAQDLASAFERAAKSLDVDEADERVARLESQLHTRLLEARRQLGQLEFDASAAGLAPPWAAVEQKLASEVEAGRKAAAPPLAAEAAGRRARLDSRRAAWLSARELRDRDKAAAAEAGPIEAIDASLMALAAERNQLRDALRALDKHGALLRDVLGHLREHPDAAECPVCRQGIAAPSVIADLEARAGSSLRAEEADLRARLQTVEAAIAAADRKRAEIVRLADAAARAEASLARARTDLATAMGRPIEAAEDPGALAARELSRLEAEIMREQQAAGAAQARMAQLEKATSRLALARRVADQERRVAKLAALRQSPEWCALLESQRKLAVRELMLQHASAAVKAHATRLAAANLERARKPITYIYSKLTQRKDFPAVTIDPADKFEVALTGADEGKVAATGILNLTDLNCLALAVTAGMAVAFPEAHDLDFLLLDDPSQGMDPQVTARLAPILGQLAKKLQIVVATPDAALVEALRSQPVYKNIITLEPRDAKASEPSVRIRGVER